MSAFDVIVVGAGHNGLVAAAALARRGLRTMVVERRPQAGGAAITSEICPGFRAPTVAHSVHVPAALATDLRLASHGLELLSPETDVFAPSADGRALVVGRDAALTADSIREFSAADARRYPEFVENMAKIRTFVSDIASAAPPEIEAPSAGDLWPLVRMGRRFRALGKRDAYRLLRWAPMAVADFASEWFESEPLRAIIAGGGIFGAALGPRSAGSTAVLLLRMAAGADRPQYARGGPGTLAAALAAAAAAQGATIRLDADVSRIDVKDGRVSGVTLADGQTLSARIVVSNADPRRTLLGLVDPTHLDPGFIARARGYRSRGVMAKLNLALDGLPTFTGATRREALDGFIHIGPTLDYLERAFDASKYGTCSARPYLQAVIPTLADPSLAPAGGHVISVTAQFAPYTLEGGGWADAGPAFADAIVDTLAAHARDLPKRIVHRQFISPADLESTFALTGGHPFHGELSLDQLFTMRPLLGWARYRTPIDGLYLCGAGTHPGYGVSGISGMNAARRVIADLSRG